MTKKEFKNLKRQIDALLKKAEEEAIAEGVNISSSEFQYVLRELKRKLLEARGIGLEEYEALEEEYEKEEKLEKETAKELLEGIEEISQKRRKEIEEKTAKIRDEFSAELQLLKEELEHQKTELENQKSLIPQKEDIIKVVRPIIPTIPKPSPKDHPEFAKALNELSKEIKIVTSQIKELADFKETIEQSIGNLEEETQEKIRQFNISIEKINNSLKEIPKKIEEVRKLAEQRVNVFRGGGGGIRELSKLDDVYAPSPLDNQALTWDAITKKWVPETISGGGGAATWGSITGTLSNQTDLQTALDNKANTALSNLANTAVNANIIPDTNSLRDLGSSSKYWANNYTQNLYLNSTAYLSGATAGAIAITGNVGIGTTNPEYALQVYGLNLPFSSSRVSGTGLFNVEKTSELVGSAGTSYYLYPIWAVANWNAPVTSGLPAVTGIAGSSWVNSNTTGTVNLLSALTFSTYAVQPAGSTINSVVGANIAFNFRTAGNITSVYGILFNTARTTAGTGTITNSYAYYYDSSATDPYTTNKYGLYIKGDNTNYFAGKVGIGTTSPAYKLDVSGDINASGNITKNGSSLILTNDAIAFSIALG